MNNVWQTISTAQVLKIVWIGTIGACFLLSSLLGVVFLVGGDISINGASLHSFSFDFALVMAIITGVLGTIVSVWFWVWSFLLGRFIVNFLLKIKPTN